jgi:hypothetical protein
MRALAPLCAALVLLLAGWPAPTIAETLVVIDNSGGAALWTYDGLLLDFGSTTPFPDVDYAQLIPSGFYPYSPPPPEDPSHYGDGNTVALRFFFGTLPGGIWELLGGGGVYEAGFTLHGVTPAGAVWGQGTMRLYLEFDDRGPEFPDIVDARLWHAFTFTETSATATSQAAALTASHAVPEPPALMLLLVAGALAVYARSRNDGIGGEK